MRPEVSRLRSFVALAASFCILIPLTGCAVLQPWETAILAREDMALALDPLRDKLDACRGRSR